MQLTVNIISINSLDMRCIACNITCMARGRSGRIVIEIDPSIKLELYAALARSNSTLKDWFLLSAEEFCKAQAQPDLFRVEPSSSPNTQRQEASFAGEQS